MIHLPHLDARRYLQPLREGGSLPAVVDTTGGLYVVKFRGAGQGPLALVAELVAGLIAGALGLPVPQVARVEVARGFGEDQADPEIRDLLIASVGTNVGLEYLDGAFNFDGRAAGDLLSADLAAEIVWFDALLTNPDRTARNPNLMVWDRRIWLIDHGSALYAHHAWARVDEARARTSFPLIADHVLLARAGDVDRVDRRLTEVLTEDRVTAIMEAVPDALLQDVLVRGGFGSTDEARGRYVTYLVDRLRPPRAWVTEITRAQARRHAEPPQRLEVRR